MSNFDSISGQSNDYQKRRIIRLLQVREQSKDIAKNLRSKASEEKSRQISLIKTAKKKEFDNAKHRSVESLKINHKISVNSIGMSHDAVQDENIANEEWRNQQKFNNLKAFHRGSQAMSVLKKNKIQEKRHKPILKTRNNESKSQIDNLPISSKVNTIDGNISENKENDNTCKNHSLIDFNKESITVNVSHDIPIVKYIDDNVLPGKENVKSTEQIEDNAPEQLLSNDICDCRSSSHRHSENNKDIKYDKPKPGSSKHDAIDNIDMISKFIKSRENVLKESIEDKKDPIAVDELTSIRDVIFQSKQFNTEYKDKYQDYSNTPRDSIKGLKSNPDLFPISADWINRPSYKIAKSRNLLSSHCSAKRKVKNGKAHSKHSPTPKWQIGTNKLNFNEKFIRSYDHLNRFNKSIAVDNNCFVERLPKCTKNAFQAAKEEVDNVERLISSIDAAQINRRQKMRGKKAGEKMKAEKDYNCLLKELETLTIAQKLLDQEEMNQDIPLSNKNERERLLFDKPSNKIPSTKRPPMHKWIPGDSSLNVADYNNLQLESDGDIISEGADKIKKIMESNGIKNQSDIKNIFKLIEDQKMTLTNELMKIASKSNKKVMRSRQTNTSEHEDNSSPTNAVVHKSVHKNKSRIKQKSKKVYIEDNHPSNSNLAHSASSVSVEGLQILIELKKDKKITANIIRNKNKEYRSMENSSNSEISLRATKITSNDNVEKSDRISFHKSDSSASTTYMSLPDKITTNFELFQHNFKSKVDSKSSVINIHNAPTCCNSAETINEKIDFGCQADVSKYEKCTGTDSFLSKPVNKYFLNKRENSEKNSKSVLTKYIHKLLEMSDSDLNKIEVDVSEITTPSNSVVNMSSNVGAPLPAIALMDKMQKLKQFIKENYTLLDDLNECFLSNDAKISSRSSSSNSQLSISKIKTAASEKIFKKKQLKEIARKKSPDYLKEVARRESPDYPKEIFKADVLQILTSKDIDDKSNKELHSKESSFSDGHEIKNDIYENVFDMKHINVSNESFKNLNIDCKLSDDNVLSPHLTRLTGGGDADLNIETDTNLIEDILKTNVDNVYVPFLIDIPKPIDLTSKDSPIDLLHIRAKDVYHRTKPPVVLSKCIIGEMPQHELSTIIEVDTPRTIRNLTLSKAHESARLSIDSVDNIKTNEGDSDSSIKSQSEIALLQLNDKSDSNVQLKPFISYKDYVKQCITDSKGSKLDISLSELTLLNTVVDTNEIDNADKVKLDNQDTFSSSTSNTDKDISDNKLLKISGLTEIKSDRSTPENFASEVDKMLTKNFGLHWGVSTLKKMRQSMVSSSSHSSISSEKLVTQDECDESNKSSTCPSLELIEFLDDIKSKEKLRYRADDDSDYKEIEILLQKFDKLKNNISKVKNTSDESQPAVVTDETEGSKDKTQHRTSTPVLPGKSSHSSSASSSRHNSNGLFGIEDDLSSVKNASSSGRNSSDHEPLSVPNVSLKFNKLFDSSLKSDK